MIDGRGGASGGQPRVELGETITLRGSGWLPFSSIDIVIRSTPRRLATVVTDAAGSFEVAVTVPRGMAPGGHTLHLTGVDASGHPRAESIPVVVVASAGGVARGLPVGARNSEGGLANTGIPVGGALLLIGVLLSGGTALLLLARRRQLAQTPLVDD